MLGFAALWQQAFSPEEWIFGPLGIMKILDV
jgi:hypothetical protein